MDILFRAGELYAGITPVKDDFSGIPVVPDQRFMRTVAEQLHTCL